MYELSDMPVSKKTIIVDLVDPAMIVRRASAGGFIRFNAAFRTLVGFDATELASRPFLDWIEPADQERARATIEEGGDGCRIRHRTRTGESLPLELRAARCESDVVVFARYTVESEQAEVHEDSTDEATVIGTLHTIAQIVEDQNPGHMCSILLVADGRFVRGAGPSLPEEYNAAIDGFAVGPTVGSCGTAIYWNVPIIVEDIQADPLWEPFAELAENAGVAACWSHPFTSKSGSVMGALALYSPSPMAPTAEQLDLLRAAARMTGLAVERGRAEEALREKRKRELELEEQLVQAAKMEALGVLAGGVAHDFNNLMATVLANAEFAQDLLPADSDVQEMLADIATASRRAGEFCQQMLAYAGRGPLKVSRVDVGKLLPELSVLVKAALSKKTSLEFTLFDGPLYVEGDENQLLQVVMNLITNAAESIGDGEGRIVVSSELVYYDESALRQLDPQAELPAGHYARLSVRDTGTGIAPKTMLRMFDPFFTTKFTGRGLGLSAVKGIITKHHGVIEIDSKVGEGTAFAILLPTTSAATSVEEPSSPDSQECAPKRILIADDEAALRSILRRRLSHVGFDVLEAADGQEAIDVFCKHRDSIDCVLLDVSMPKRNGQEVEREMHAVRADLPIVLMSGFNRHEVRNQFGEADIAGSLQKPVTKEALLSVIREAMATD